MSIPKSTFHHGLLDSFGALPSVGHPQRLLGSSSGQPDDTSRSFQGQQLNAHKLDLSMDSVFVLSDRQEVIVHLPTFDWDFSPGDVRLCSPGEELPFRQVGSGNHEGRPVVLLRPLTPWRDVDRFFHRTGGAMLSIMR